MQCINLNKVYRYFLTVQYIVYKTVGLSPWTLNVSEVLRENVRIDQIQKSISKISYIGSGYNFILVLAYAVYGLYCKLFPNENEVSLIDNQTYKMVMEMASFITTASTCWIVIFFIYSQKSMMNVIDRLIIINQKLNTNVDCYSKDPLSYFIFIINFLVSLVKMLLMLPNSSIIPVLFTNFTHVVCSWIIVQFTLLLSIVGKQIEVINLSINKIGDLRSDLSQTPALRVNILLADESACREIDNIKRVYIELCDVSGEINDLYGLNVLISLLDFSFTVIENLHLIFILPSPEEISLIIFNIELGMIVPWGIFLFLVLTSEVSKITDQNKKTGQIINLLLNRRPINPKAKKQLTKFSNDLSHFKIEFSACGALPLDRDLIGIASGTIATFLVIITQGADLNRTPVSARA